MASNECSVIAFGRQYAVATELMTRRARQEIANGSVIFLYVIEISIILRSRNLRISQPRSQTDVTDFDPLVAAALYSITA